MKINKIYLVVSIFIIFALVLRFTVLQKPDTRLLYTVQNNTFLETVEVSGIFNETASDTQKAVSYAAYQSAISALVTAKQNKQAADATMWTKQQAFLNAENSVNYKKDYTQNPTTIKDYTELEKISIDSGFTQAQKDFRAAETKYKESDVAVGAALAQVNLTKIDYDDTRIGEPYLVVNVSEVYIPKINVGQNVGVVFDAMKDVSLTGQVEHVDSVGTVTAGIVTFEVKISIGNLPSGIKPNMTAIATIELINKKKTLTVPRSALIYKDDKVFVRLAEAKNDTLTEVRLGEKGFSKVEIVSGLNTGAIILARPETKSL